MEQQGQQQQEKSQKPSLASFVDSSDGTKHIQLTPNQQFLIVKNLCAAISSFHQQENSQYGFLFPENILIDSDFNVSLRQVDNLRRELKREHMNWTYTAPEMLKYFRSPLEVELTPKLDIWSLGLLINVIFTLKNLRFSRGCVGFVAVSPYFFEIVQMCMKLQPDDRPLAGQISEFMEDFQDKFLQNSSNDFVEAVDCFQAERRISLSLTITAIKEKAQNKEQDSKEEKQEEFAVRMKSLDLEELTIVFRSFAFFVVPKRPQISPAFIAMRDSTPFPLQTNTQIVSSDSLNLKCTLANGSCLRLNIRQPTEGNVNSVHKQSTEGTDDDVKQFEFNDIQEDDVITIGNDPQIYSIPLERWKNAIPMEIFRKGEQFYVRIQPCQSRSSSTSSNCSNSGNNTNNNNVNAPIFDNPQKPKPLLILVGDDVALRTGDVLCCGSKSYQITAIQ